MKLNTKITKSGAYIIDPINKKILIIISNYDPVKIGIPKGSIENNEKLYECAEREIKEETGLNIKIKNKKITKRILNGLYFFVYINNGSKNFIPNPDNLNKREIKESKWVDINFLEENKKFCNITLKKNNNIINLPYLKYNKKIINNELIDKEIKKSMDKESMDKESIDKESIDKEIKKSIEKNQKTFCNIL